ncbi:hypothetical protein [Priestia flexa]|jgi:hypothetical protein|uniref:hypothetical protein n=1 Tax=Priestia flexa TaxID=86664 RepID=UPI0011A0108D|nr:hypothetical protein [Priestia flexa]
MSNQYEDESFKKKNGQVENQEEQDDNLVAEAISQKINQERVEDEVEGCLDGCGCSPFGCLSILVILISVVGYQFVS